MKHPKKQLPSLPSYLGQLSPRERNELLRYLGVSRTQLWRYEENPGKTPVEHAHTITLYLDAVMGGGLTMCNLFGLAARQFGDRSKARAKAA